MSVRTHAFSLAVAVLLALASLPGIPVTATSPPSPLDDCQTTAAPVFFDDMEGDVSDWTATGFWHQVANPQTISVYHAGAATPEDPPNDVNPDLVTLPDTNASGRAYLGSAYSGSRVFWYGVDEYGCFIDPAGTFDPGTQSAKNGGTSSAVNSGSLVSPAIDLTGLTAASLYFWTWWEIEGTDADMFDMMYVEISTDGGGRVSRPSARSTPSTTLTTSAMRTTPVAAPRRRRPGSVLPSTSVPTPAA